MILGLHLYSLVAHGVLVNYDDDDDSIIIVERFI